MTVYLIPEIWCERCDYRHQPDDNVELDELANWPESFRAAIEGDGWTRDDDDMDLCPDCSEKAGET